VNNNFNAECLFDIEICALSVVDNCLLCFSIEGYLGIYCVFFQNFVAPTLFLRDVLFVISQAHFTLDSMGIKAQC